MSFDQIIVRSSPFIRTVMTASNIAEQLGVKSVQIDSHLGEHLDEMMFPTNPIPVLEIYNSEFDKSKYLISCDIDTSQDSFDLSECYPENRDRGMVRALVA